MTHTVAPGYQVNRRRPWLPMLAVAAGVVVVAAIITTVFLATSPESGMKPAADMFPVSSPLAEASETCTAGTLGDDDQTLMVDMAGEELGSGTASVEDVMCVLNELDTPQAILAQMASTRALDGMQSAEWSTYAVKWTYHPDNGLDLIITHEG
jgi:hypothetical protein